MVVKRFGKEYYLEKARHFLSDYTDEIPEEVLHNAGSTHKVSAGWFQHVLILFKSAEHDGFSSENYYSTFRNYLKNTKYLNLDLHDGGRLTRFEDIALADWLLERFIVDLSDS